MNTAKMIQQHREEARSIAQDLPEPLRGQALACLDQANWFDAWSKIVQQVLADHGVRS